MQIALCTKRWDYLHFYCLYLNTKHENTNCEAGCHPRHVFCGWTSTNNPGRSACADCTRCSMPRILTGNDRLKLCRDYTPDYPHFKLTSNLLLCIVRCRSHPRHNTDEHSAVGPLKSHLTVCSVPRCYPLRGM